VYWKLTAKGRGTEPKWLGPYQVVRKITDRDYKIQIGKRYMDLNIEQLKLCRASRQQLCERRKRNQQRVQEQRSRRELRQLDSDEDLSTESDTSSTYSFAIPEHPRMNYKTANVSKETSTQIDRECESDAGHCGNMSELRERDNESPEAETGQSRYLLRQRIRRNYKE
jgi:hypothetical protein